MPLVLAPDTLCLFKQNLQKIPKILPLALLQTAIFFEPKVSRSREFCLFTIYVGLLSFHPYSLRRGLDRLSTISLLSQVKVANYTDNLRPCKAQNQT
ncbi:hypothetical protein BG554_12360 [Mannheimia haemolytica]|nr:hypothetical protein L278_08385 [Mannheimia haemolytica D35]EPZ25932.1 hypothetical protein L281_03565 [Mannheimia haemolytica MhSwine2000]KYL20673.1 hypothetical protein AC572_01155 [Mannheimia haemolytica]KYL27875.1 hypothetical protein AC575_02920 [Mannheimia haemolytica]QEA92717.1 hypothetical protein BG558_12270 [Mannheimia haemolytica]